MKRLLLAVMICLLVFTGCENTVEPEKIQEAKPAFTGTFVDSELCEDYEDCNEVERRDCF
ncbi:hypothetical protein ACFLZX_03485 [Nanoarchaeota archaeon]